MVVEDGGAVPVGVTEEDETFLAFLLLLLSLVFFILAEVFEGRRKTIGAM